MPKLTFSVDSALLSELGEKLVETAHIALVELVKNAYDADATRVTVKIIPHGTAGPEIQVIDNGSGMTFNEVQNYWMRIATTHKVVQQASPKYGRPRTGSKGIGRFSCRRLGTLLRLTSTARRGDALEQTQIVFNWLEFKAGREISTVECEGTRVNLRGGEPGTILVISGGAVDEWRKRGYNFLKRQLAVLASNRGKKRRGFEEDPGFDVALDAPGFDEKIENLRDRLLSAGWGDLSVHVNREGEASCTLSALRIGTKEIIHPEKFPTLVGVSAKIGVMSVSRDEMRDKEVLSKSSLSEILDDWGGVYVRYRGFRVYPYGESTNDWLHIERDRAVRKTSLSPLLHPFAAGLRGVNPQRALLSLLSNKNYIGDVEVDERAKGFEMKASREGFIGEDGIGPLRELIRFAIDWSTIYREHFRSLEARDENERAREEFETQLKRPLEATQIVTSALEVVRSEARQLAAQLPTEERQQILRSLRTATDAIQTHESSSQEELRHLRLVASTSTLLLIFSHEVKSLMSWFEQINISLDRIRRRISEPEGAKLNEIREEITSTKSRFIELLEMTSLISVDSRKAQPDRLNLLERFDRAKRCFNLITESYGVDINLDGIDERLKVGPILEAELYAIALNVLSNSIKSVIAAGAGKTIQVTAERRDSKVYLHVRDSGVGIDDQFYDEVFVPFIADPQNRLYRGLKRELNPEDQYVIGTGSGLGLSIVREIVSHRGGRIHFLPPTDGWKADLEIELP